MKHLGFYTGYRKASPEKPSTYLLVVEEQEDSWTPFWGAWNPYGKDHLEIKWMSASLGKSKGLLSVPLEYML